MKYPHEIGTVTPLNDEAYAVVTGLQTEAGELLVGPVARGGCMVVGESACKAVCQMEALRRGSASQETAELAEAGLLNPELILEENPQACADKNLAHAFDRLSINPEHAVMVAVGMNKTANRVGYIGDPKMQAEMTQNPHGWFEISGTTPYNAVYAKKGDVLPNGEPVELIGMRIGGNGVVVDEITQEDGNVYGLTHLTRTNLPGTGYEESYAGEVQTYRNYVASDSLRHYNGEPAQVKTHIISAVGRETARIKFAGRDIDNIMPGWSSDGLITNTSNPHWKPGMEVANDITGEYDILQRDYPQQIRRHVRGAAEKLGITDIREDHVLDPGITTGGIIHSSADRARNAADKSDKRFAGETTDRDLYAVVFKRS